MGLFRINCTDLLILDLRQKRFFTIDTVPFQSKIYTEIFFMIKKKIHMIGGMVNCVFETIRKMT